MRWSREHQISELPWRTKEHFEIVRVKLSVVIEKSAYTEKPNFLYSLRRPHMEDIFHYFQ